MLWPALRYPLAATTFTPEEGEAIMIRLYQNILPTLGCARTFPKVYRHGPACLQGLELPSIYVEQEICHIRDLLVHGAISTVQGQITRASMEQAQLEIGLSTPFLSSSFDTFGFLLTDCLLKSLWRFVSEHGIQLLWKECAVPTRQREFDFFLMEELVELHVMSEAELISFNRCRVFTQACTFADIATGDGRKIRRDRVDCLTRDRQKSCYAWAKEVPCAMDRQRWRKRLAFLTSKGLVVPPLEGLWTGRPPLRDTRPVGGHLPQFGPLPGTMASGPHSRSGKGEGGDTG